MSHNTHEKVWVFIYEPCRDMKPFCICLLPLIVQINIFVSFVPHVLIYYLCKLQLLIVCFNLLCLLLHQDLNKLKLLTEARERLPATNKRSWFPSFHFIIQSIRLIQLGSFSVSRQATKHTYLHTHLHTHAESVLNACEAGRSRSGTHPSNSPFPSWG